MYALLFPPGSYTQEHFPVWGALLWLLFKSLLCYYIFGFRREFLFKINLATETSGFVPFLQETGWLACLSHLEQWSPTPGPQTGTGPWIKWYRAAQGTLNYFSLHAVAALGLGLILDQRAAVKLSNVDRSAVIKRLGTTVLLD